MLESEMLESELRSACKEVLVAVHDLSETIVAWETANLQAPLPPPSFLQSTISAMLKAAVAYTSWEWGLPIEDDTPADLEEILTRHPVMRSEPGQSFRVVRENKRFDDKRE